MRSDWHLGIEERVWSKIDLSAGAFACWPWVAFRDKDGYGKFSETEHGPCWRVPILIFWWEYGWRPKYVCHSCDHPWCCNPRHLFAGDAQINAADRNMKGRQCRGVMYPKAKINDEIAKQIKVRFVPKHPENGAAPLAMEFGVSSALIYRIARGEKWAHVT
jgi:hypothetical protein